MDTCSLGDLRWRCAEMLGEQSSEMSCADADPRGKRFDIRAVGVERTFLDNQPSGTFHGGAAPTPCRTEWSCFRSASKAWAESSRFGGSCARKKADILRMCRSNRAHRPTVDPRGSDAGKEPSVIGRIAAYPRLLAFRMVEHREPPLLARCPGGRSPIPASVSATESVSDERVLGLRRYLR